MHIDLVNDGGRGLTPTPMNAIMSDPSQWSDWNGKPATDPAVTEAFVTATQNVREVGLSFGGGCFFENDVTVTSGTATFNSTFSET